MPEIITAAAVLEKITGMPVTQPAGGPTDFAGAAASAGPGPPPRQRRQGRSGPGLQAGSCSRPDRRPPAGRRTGRLKLDVDPS